MTEGLPLLVADELAMLTGLTAVQRTGGYVTVNIPAALWIRLAERSLELRGEAESRPLSSALAQLPTVPLEELQIEYTRVVLARFQGNRSLAAKALNIGRSRMFRAARRGEL